MKHDPRYDSDPATWSQPVKLLRELLRAHYWPDPVWAILFDMFIVVFLVFCVLAGLRFASR